MTTRERRPFTIRCAKAWLVALALAATTAAADPREDLDAAEAAFGRQDWATALQLVRPLAEDGNAEAQASLAMLYSRGLGLPQDSVAAIEWYRKSAEQGNVRAQHNLAVMYITGRGVVPDPAAAMKWMRMAADRGDAVAQFRLAGMYENGQGAQKSLVEAYRWYSLAATKFSANDQERRIRTLQARDHIAKKMTPADVAKAEKLARGWKPK